MDRAASLRKRAGDVRRRVFASLPHYVRVALVFEKLADTQLRALGRPLGAVFVIKGVTGLPDLGPNAEKIEAAKGNKDLKTITRYLPANFLESFAGEIRRGLIAKFHNVDLVDESISGWLIRFVALGGWEQMIVGMDIRGAKNYVLTAIKNEALNKIKSRQRKHEDRSLQETDDEGKSTFNPADPRSLRDHDIPPWREPKIRRILEQNVHPDAPLFLDLLYEGHGMKSITGDPRHGKPGMLPHYNKTYEHWQFHINPVIKKVFETAGVQDEALEYLEDRHL